MKDVHSFRLSVYHARLRLRDRWGHLPMQSGLQSVRSRNIEVILYSLVRSRNIPWKEDSFLSVQTAELIESATRYPVGFSIAGERGVYPGACIAQKVSYDILLLARNLNIY